VRLLISGYYGAGNLGDEAVLAGLLGAIAGADVMPVVASLDPSATTRAHGVAAVHRYRGLPWALWRADAVLSGGGGLLQDVTSARSLRYYLAVVRGARTLGKPVAVYGQSLGPLSPAGAARVRRALRHVPMGLRDAPSLALAARWGLTARAVADPALLVPAPLPAAGEGRLGAAGAGAGALVLIPRARFDGIGTVLAELGRRHLGEGGRVRIALVHPGHDAVEAERLAAALPGAERVAAATVAELLAALWGARAVVSGRLHGLVLGAVADAPVAGLAYDPKVTGFADAIGAPSIGAPAPGDARAVAEAVDALTRFVAAPFLDRAAVARATALARDGVVWLLTEALRPAS
jgi:polysaccharide pyruvyl transferase CsaB